MLGIVAKPEMAGGSPAGMVWWICLGADTVAAAGVRRSLRLVEVEAACLASPSDVPAAIRR